MFLQPRSRIYLALFIAVILACGLYFIGRGPFEHNVVPTIPQLKPLAEEGLLVSTGDTASSFWAGNLNAVYGTESWAGATKNEGGAILSHLQIMYSSENAGNLILGSDGTIYGGSAGDLIAYHPDTSSFKIIPVPFSWDAIYAKLTLASDNRLYGIAWAGVNPYNTLFSDQRNRLFAVNPRTSNVEVFTPVSETLRLAAGQNGFVYGFEHGVWPDWVYDPTAGNLTPLTTTILPGCGWFSNFLYGHDGLLDGVLICGSREYAVAAIDITGNKVFTHEISSPYSTLALHPDAGIYVSTGQEDPHLFDPLRHIWQPLALPTGVTPFQMYVQAVTPNGWIYGTGDAWSDSFLFAYQPAQGIFKQLGSTVGGSLGSAIVGRDGQVYGAWRNQIVTVKYDTYAPTGSVQSELIQPIALALTRTVIAESPNAIVHALTCNQNETVYGVIQGADSYFWQGPFGWNFGSYPTKQGWLFEYHPQGLDANLSRYSPEVSPEQRGEFMYGTALVAANDGALIGGTNSGHLFLYNPHTGNTLDLGRPTPDTDQIAALTTGQDGLIYGGTVSYNGQARLFSIDPVRAQIKLLELPITQTYAIGPLAVGPNGQVYVSVGATLIAYEPASRQATILGDTTSLSCTIQALAVDSSGQVYAGCGPYLASYDESTGLFNQIAKPGKENSYNISGNVAALVIGHDMQVYGSVERNYSNSELFVYRPDTKQSLYLGIAIPTGVKALTVCPDGTIYGSSGTNNSYYGGPAYLFAFRSACLAGPLHAWDRLAWEADTPPGTNLTVDVLDEKGEVLLSQVGSGGSLHAIDAQQHPAIRLRANLSTADSRVTPVLKRWRVDYTFACQK